MSPQSLRAEKQVAAAASASNLSGLRVLIADDNVLNQKIIRKMIESLGLSEIVIANNGKVSNYILIIC